jgi:hypothetical protein
MSAVLRRFCRTSSIVLCVASLSCGGTGDVGSSEQDASRPDSGATGSLIPDAGAPIRDAGVDRGSAESAVNKPCYSENSAHPDHCACDDFNFGDVTAVSTCSRASVATSADEAGSCCQYGSSYCECVSYTCRSDSATQTCTCQRVLNSYGTYDTGTRMAACPDPGAGQKCCQETTGWPRTCTCSPAKACYSGQIEVANCTAAVLADACPSSEVSVAACL